MPNLTTAEATGLCVLALIICALVIIFFPMILIWALNVLIVSAGLTAIPLTWKTWFAALLIIMILGRGASGINTKSS